MLSTLAIALRISALVVLGTGSTLLGTVRDRASSALASLAATLVINAASIVTIGVVELIFIDCNIGQK